MTIIENLQENENSNISAIEELIESGTYAKTKFSLAEKEESNIKDEDFIKMVKNGPFTNGTGKQKLYVKVGDKLIRREIVIGESNFDYVEIISGLEVGEQIVISDLSERIHQKQIKLKK